jgi:hypothetical protein
LKHDLSICGGDFTKKQYQVDISPADGVITKTMVTSVNADGTVIVTETDVPAGVPTYQQCADKCSELGEEC